MPRNGSGVQSWPAGTAAVSGDPISSTAYNAFLADLLSDLNAARPIVAGGTGATTASGALTALGVDAAILAATPIGTILDYAGSTAPTGFLLCYGQAISRTTYSDLFAVIGETYGVGDGSTTFNLPDLRGRVIAGKDDMGGSSANRLTDADDGLDGDTLGDTGGGETQALIAANNGPHTHTGTTDAQTIDAVPTDGSFYASASGSPNGSLVGGGTGSTTTGTASINTTGGNGSHTHTFTTDSQGSGTAFGIVQPTIILNKIIKCS
jgi:microcystin-dependent protein